MLYYGCDTETYNETIVKDGKEIRYIGLKSIQLCNSEEQNYFTSDDFTQSDESIRYEISKKFIDFLDTRKEDVKVAFFNMTFDVSQFLYYLIAHSGYSLVHEYTPRLSKGQMSFLETDRKLFSVKFRSYKSGYQIQFIDIANFAVASTLDQVSESWLNKRKVSIESKIFPKKPATEIEKKYALQDAILTYELYVKFLQESVIEKNTYTIAGRTIKHFKQYCKEEYLTSFEYLMFGTEDKDEIVSMKEEFERELRCGVRGGICQAFHKGVYEDVTHIDARSMYPTQCVRDFVPFGGLLKEEPNALHTKIVYPSGWYTLKPNCVPCVQWTNKANLERYHYINDYECGDYVNDFYLDGSYPIWQEEYNIIKKQYNVEHEEIEKTWYILLKENIILKSYVNMLYEGKKNNKGAKRLYYKYLLNALYGKFLTRPDGVTIDYFEESDGWHRTKLASEKSTFYLPLGNCIGCISLLFAPILTPYTTKLWIAMMGRVTLMSKIISIPSENFLYCDTDSMIFKGNIMPDINIGKELGDWSIEKEHVKVNVVGPKTYQE